MEMPVSKPDFADEKHRILAQVFGFEGFRPGQVEVIDALMLGESVLAVMPTGAGKSLCFQVPALALGGLTIVVSPLLALMQDQVSALQLAGVRAETINSARDRAENVAVWRRVAAGEVSLLYLSPERLMTERMLDALARLPVRLIAVDEAHCISQWGPAFRPEYSDLVRLRGLFPDAAMVALTATADAITRRDIAAKLFGEKARIFVQGFDRPNIHLAVTFKAEWKQQMLAFLARHAGESGIVYCLSRKKTEETAALLLDHGVAALPYHAGMEKWQRDGNQDSFMREEGVVMVATIAFGMGIDKPDVRFVLHTDLPGSMEAYYQEFGRAGRDGAPAQALMLYGLGDIRMRRQFIEQEGGGEERRRQEHKRLDALLAYCEAPQCRRQPLLAYFGEEAEPCGNCDLCLDTTPAVEGTDLAQLALAAIRDTGQRFGAAHIVDVLCGANNEKVRKFGHERLDSHGAGKARRKPEWQSILRQLLAGGYLQLDMEGFGGMALDARGQALLRGEEDFFYRPDATPQPRGGGGQQRAATRAGAHGGTAARADAPDLSERDQDLLGALKALRSRLSKARGVPAYVVFSDRSLADMALQRPTSVDEFAAVHGVGQAKLKKFANTFLAAIAEHGQ